MKKTDLEEYDDDVRDFNREAKVRAVRNAVSIQMAMESQTFTFAEKYKAYQDGMEEGGRWLRDAQHERHEGFADGVILASLVAMAEAIRTHAPQRDLTMDEVYALAYESWLEDEDDDEPIELAYHGRTVWIR